MLRRASLLPLLAILAAACGGGSASNEVPPVSAAAPVGTMTHSIAIKHGASARGNNEGIDLFRRPAGLADGLALKEPAPRDAQVAVRPN